MVRGDVELQWALEHHPKWVKEVEASRMENEAEE
jgi:cytochrome b subunit of formate dehydrogenase